MAESAPGIDLQPEVATQEMPKLLVIGGVMRGGTTLLRSILASHPRVELFANELRVLTWCGKSMPDHAARIHYHLLLRNRWLHFPAFRRQVYRYLWHLVRANGLFRSQVTVGMSHRAFAACLARAGTQYVGDKYPDYVFHVPQFEHHANCRTVLIIRDPRDVVASILYRIRHGDWAGQGWARRYASIEAASLYWNKAARVMHEARDSGGGVLIVRYEDLVMARDATESRLAGFLGLDPGGFEGSHAHVDSVGKHMLHLDAADLRTIETVTAELTPAFGYSVSASR